MHSATELPLHGGKAPRWLYQRMVKLGRAIGLVIIDEYGADGLLERMSQSNWFQALACAIGYDWHSSGTTTVTAAAMKEALNETKEIFIAGGKGEAGLKTPDDIDAGTSYLSISGMGEEFKKFSRLSAKVDSAMVYDSIGIYQHSFIFTKNKKWGVIQQGMVGGTNKAVRFQWFSENISKEIVEEPHSSISSSLRKVSLDLTYNKNNWARKASIDAVNDGEVEKLIKYPSRHEIIPQIDIGKRGLETMKKAGEMAPESYEDLLLVKGVGRRVVRSLAFVASLIYDTDLSYRDPVTYSYALGGKDGIPFPINRQTYDGVIDSMEEIIDAAKIEKGEKYKALRRLNSIVSKTS